MAVIGSQLEVVDLRHFSARQMRPLLESEAVAWEKKLRWNYRSSTELLLQYLDSRVLPGFVALDRGRICGFTFCVYEGAKAVIGDAFALGDGAEQQLSTTRTLLGHMLELLQNSPTVNRIESQLLLYDASMIHKTFEDAGFVTYPRLFLELELERNALPNEMLRVPVEGIQMQRWSTSDYQPAAELIHSSYGGHVDSRINDQYQTLHGSMRFLHNIVRFPGCGVFDGEESWVLRVAATGELVGMILCSRVADNVAHVTQLCVLPRFSGQQLGGTLLRHCIRHLGLAGFGALTLTVTEENARAIRLYREAGFQTRHRFDAMVFERAQRS